jgi:alpha-galactosidase
VTSFAPKRYPFWRKDIEIAARHGVDLFQGENGGPAGQIHALRNIRIMQEIVADIAELCPSTWVMNFTNPMSMLCTYLYKHTPVNAVGFCHQVHGSFGVVSEMLGMEPGDLQIVSAGINHMNFLLDVRRKGTSQSYMAEFLEGVRRSPYWQKVHEYIPEQAFTLEFLNTFGIYPVGYDGHICEYMPFFYSKAQWEEMGYKSCVESLLELEEFRGEASATGTVDDVEVDRILGQGKFPFPKDPAGDYYRESPVEVMEALLTSKPLYLDAMVIVNNGCVSNLPYDAVVDIPAVVVGGKPRGIAVGALPTVGAELCRRQIVIHDLIAQAAVEHSRQKLLEAMCLDPFVRSLKTARELVEDYVGEYAGYLPELH